MAGWTSGSMKGIREQVGKWILRGMAGDRRKVVRTN